MKGVLYLIPAPVSPQPDNADIPNSRLPGLFSRLKYLIVEDIRTSRRFMRQAGYKGDFEDIEFFDMGKHADEREFLNYLQPCLTGADTGLLSEAGMPCIADPGSIIVSLAHSSGIRVVPLPGPSSLFMALAASGLNGQRFEFHGYLPIDTRERRQALQNISRDSIATGKSHIFMEAPFRNDKLLQAVLSHCSPDINLCIASSLSSEKEEVRTRTIREWQAARKQIGKVPAVFIIGQPQ